MFVSYNANPTGKHIGDCTVRAISKALDQSWDITYLSLCLYGYMFCDMPSANHVWGSYLKSRGFARHVIPSCCPDCYTVRDFCEDHPNGTYILAIDGHVVTVCEGCYYDTWDSGDQVPLYFWERKEEK